MIRRILILLCVMAAAAGPARGQAPGPISQAEPDPFDKLTETVLSYFLPLSGTVLHTGVDTAVCDIPEHAGIRVGMRLSVLRRGAPFFHPITKETIGETEELVGEAEVVGVGPDGATLRILSGDVEPGDVLRLSSGRVRVLFHQGGDVDWNLAQEHYYRLKETGRFDLIDTAPGPAANEEVLAEATNLNAQVAIVISDAGTPGPTVLRQRLLWVKDGKEFSSVEVTLSDDAVRKFRLGEEFFAPEEDVPIVSFTIPFGTRRINTGDLDGDGKMEIILSTGSELRFYSFGASLRPALNAAEIKAGPSDDHLWLDVDDVDGDGRDELLFTAIESSGVTSYLYGFREGDFRQEWRGEGLFARFIDGKLFVQESSRRGGYKGPVRQESLGGEGSSETLHLPEKVNIYDFRYVQGPAGSRSLLAYDRKGHLTLYGEDGALLWRSSDSYGGHARTIEKQPIFQTPQLVGEDNNPSADLTNRETWHVSDRLIESKGSTFALKRFPFAKQALGLGFKKSQIVTLFWQNSAVTESLSLDEMPGAIIDFAVADNRVFVLSSSLGINPANLLKGKGLFTTKLYVYSLNGA